MSHWFEPLADHMGEAYLRYSFTKGTRQEVDFLWEALDLAAGRRVLDVGCGPGRHALEFARRGAATHGIDIAQAFVDIGRSTAAAEGLTATFERADARDLLEVPSRNVDAVVCLCQGAFGLMTEAGDDQRVLDGLVHHLRPGGLLALSAFNAYFSVRYHEEARFDAASGVSHEITEIRSPQGEVRSVDLWTGCYTPRELRLMVGRAGAEVAHIWSVAPGEYRRAEPDTDSPEFLVVARRV